MPRFTIVQESRAGEAERLQPAEEVAGQVAPRKLPVDRQANSSQLGQPQQHSPIDSNRSSLQGTPFITIPT